jgi:hypothetical protein
MTFSSFSQEKYDVDGQTYTLKTEVSGTLDLLWNVIDKQYRYFIKKGAAIVELKNTKNATKDFQEEYKATLKNLTSGAAISSEDLKFTLPSLRDFVNDYNASQDPDYIIEGNRFKLQTRFGIFGGLSNVPFVENPDNVDLSMFFGELEFLDGANDRRHSVYFRGKHIAEDDLFAYATTQLGLGYRFKVIKSRVFNLYTNVTFATLNFSKTTITTETEPDIITKDVSATNFDIPFILGVGMEIRLANSLFFTVDYDEIFAVFLNNQGNSSRHFSFGAKFNL